MFYKQTTSAQCGARGSARAQVSGRLHTSGGGCGRSLPDEVVDVVPLGDVRLRMFDAAVPWRVFRWYRKQRHFSGSYWSATMGAPVGYESRLEYANLLLADFDPGVDWILSQPFLVAEVFTGKAGEITTLEETISSFEEICDGKWDHLPEQAFMYVGPIAQAEEQARKMAVEA